MGPDSGRASHPPLAASGVVARGVRQMSRGAAAVCTMPLFLVSTWRNLTPMSLVWRLAAPASNGRTTVTKKVTLSTSKPRTGSKHVLSARDENAETVEVTEEGAQEPEGDAGADSIGGTSHALYARNLCPVCPSGVSVKARSVFDRYFSQRTFQYCGDGFLSLSLARR